MLARKYVIFIWMFLFCFSSFVYADVIFLKNGSKMFGEVVERNAEGVRLKMEYGEVFFKTEEIQTEVSPINTKPVSAVKRLKKKTKTVKFALPIGKRFKQNFAGVNCTVYYPSAFTPEKRYPLVVGLEPNGNGDVYMNLLESGAEEYGYIAVCPWTENGSQWRVDEDWKIVNVVKEFIDRYKANRCKIYATGFSGGGVFTYIVGLNNPKYITAIAPVCAHYACAARFSSHKKGRKVNILMLHGDNDDICPMSDAKEYHRQLIKKGYKAELKIIKGMGHESRRENNRFVFSFFDKNVKRHY